MAVGEAVEVAEGVMGVVGTCEELTRLAAEVEVGVAAVDGLERKHQEGRNLINIYARFVTFMTLSNPSVRDQTPCGGDAGCRNAAAATQEVRQTRTSKSPETT